MRAPLAQPRPTGAQDRLIHNPKLRFLDQCREVLRFRQLAYRTEESYVDWIRRFKFLDVFRGIERSESAVLRAESQRCDSLGWSAQRAALPLESVRGMGTRESTLEV
jgi:hypothetical protein